jgi:tetratricopeptide (TPR) repeat protein
LSDDRAKEIEKYYRAKLDEFTYGKIEPAKGKGKKGKKAAHIQPAKDHGIQFIAKSLIEDWRPFVDTLNAYTGFSAAEKSEILAIVNGTEGTFPEKELKLQALATYPKLFVEVYPRMRFARTEISAIKAKKSEAEIVLLAKEASQGNKASLDKLNEKELAYAATLTPDLNEREAIYRASIKKNDLWQSHNNLAAIVLTKALKVEGEERTTLLNAAIVNLSISVNKQANAYGFANLGLAKALLVDLVGAKEALINAEASADTKVLPLVNSVKGAIAVREGKYANAIANLSSGDNSATAQFDLGLAYLMTKDYPNAKAAFARAQTQNPNVAIYDYAAAIAAARTKTTGVATSELKKAFSKKPGLKQLALKDAEFNTITGNDTFVNALK